MKKLKFLLYRLLLDYSFGVLNRRIVTDLICSLHNEDNKREKEILLSYVKAGHSFLLGEELRLVGGMACENAVCEQQAVAEVLEVVPALCRDTMIALVECAANGSKYAYQVLSKRTDGWEFSSEIQSLVIDTYFRGKKKFDAPRLLKNLKVLNVDAIEKLIGLAVANDDKEAKEILQYRANNNKLSEDLLCLPWASILKND